MRDRDQEGDRDGEERERGVTGGVRREGGEG